MDKVCLRNVKYAFAKKFIKIKFSLDVREKESKNIRYMRVYVYIHIPTHIVRV